MKKKINDLVEKLHFPPLKVEFLSNALIFYLCGAYAM